MFLVGARCLRNAPLCVVDFNWWACLDSNQEPDRYERRPLPGSSSKISVSRSRSFTFVRVCSRGFCRITGGKNVKPSANASGDVRARGAGNTADIPETSLLTRFGSAPRRWQIVRVLEAGAIRLLLGEGRKESCSGQNTSIVGKRGSAVMQSQR